MSHRFRSFEELKYANELFKILELKQVPEFPVTGTGILIILQIEFLGGCFQKKMLRIL